MAKQRQNYFDTMIRQNGEDFLVTLSPDAIQKAAKRRIFREMIQGQIDYSEYGKYYQEPKFFDNLLQAAYDELQNNQILLACTTEYDINHPGIDLVIKNRAKFNQTVYVYSILYNTLSIVKANGYNVGYLSNLSMSLGSYRNILS